MNSLERFEAAIKLEVPDVPPILYQHFGGGEWILRELGLTMQKAHESPQNIMDCQVRARQVFGHDNMIAGWGAYVEAHALGSVWSWENKTYYYPRITKYRLASPEDLSSLTVPDPFNDHTMRTYIEALGLMVKKYGSDVAILGFVNSPLIAAEELRGCESLFMDMVLNPVFYKKTIDLMTETCIKYATAMIKEAGVHGILIEDGSLGKDQQSRSGAIENNLESTARLVDAIKYTGRWTLIHNCSSEPYLDLHAKLKPSAIDYWVKAKVNPEKVKMDLESTCISTGVDGMSDTVLASPSQIESTILDSYRNYGTEGGFIISTGGEIPLKAPVENIWAIKRAAEKCRSK